MKLHPEVLRVVVKKSCQWVKERVEDKVVADFVGTLNSKDWVRRLCIKQTFRGGVVEPLALCVDAQTIQTRLEKIYGQGGVGDTTGSFIDINSMYPSQLTPGFSYSPNPVDFVMSPVGGHVVLLGPHECYQKCEASCVRRCGRFDRHECQEGVNCFQTCKRHYDSAEWGKLPGFALVKILPPKNVRFPILRMQLGGDVAGKNFSTLCATCAREGNAFEGLKSCGHGDSERALFGEFTTGNFLTLSLPAAGPYILGVPLIILGET